MANTRELILRFSGDPRQLRQTMAALRTELAQFSQGQISANQGVVRQAQQNEQRRVAETIRSANQRLREEQRAAREVARIVAQTARQAEQQEKVRERAAKQLADVQIREGKRAARELERSLAQSRATAPTGSGVSALVGNIATSVPGIGNLASQFSAITSAASGAGAAIAAVAVPIAGLVVGVGALTVGLAALAVKFFDLTKQTAEFQGKFFDLSQQVGVSVETLSTLDVIASTTGGNIETVTASLALFQRNLEEAHDPTSKEAKLLKELSVTSLDTEVALRQTLKGLFALGEGAKQTDATLQLFGRSGRFINAILKESGGDLDAATKKFNDMGLIVGGPAARAADLFNDSLEILDRQIKAIAIGITSQAIPAIIVLAQELSTLLTGSANSWTSWGDVAQAQIIGVTATLKALKEFIASRGTVDFGTLFDTAFDTLLARVREVRAKILAENQIEFVERLNRAVLAGRPGDRPDPDKARSEAQARANKAIQLQQQALEESTRQHRAALEREREKDLKNIDDWEHDSIGAIADHVLAQGRLYEQELANARQFIKNKEDLRLAEDEIAIKRQKTTQAAIEEIDKVKDEAQRRRDQTELELNRQLAAIRETARQGELRRIQDQLDRQEISEEGAALRRLAILKQEQEERLLLIDLELGQLTTSAARKVQLDNEKLASEQRYTDEFKRLTQERIDGLLKEGAQRVPAPATRPLPEPPKKVFSGDVFEDGVLVEVPERLSAWTIALETVKEGFRGLEEQMRSFAAFAGGTVIDVVRGIAGAVASGVEAWALYGESFGKAMKQALAASLARIAGEATFQGALHAAYAIGSLALLDFRGAAQHALAAAKFFAVAAATGIGARAIAGNSFAGSGGAGSSGAQRQGPPQPLQTIVQGRNQPQPQVIRHEHVLRVESNDSHVVKIISKNFRDGGELRELVFNDGGAG